MTQINLKGLNRTKKTLADGRIVVYYYLGKGGPRLTGQLGSPEFIASYHAALEAQRRAPKDTLQSVIDAFQASSNFTNLAPKTQKDYKKHFKQIEAEFGDFPLKAVQDRRTRGEFLAWRDRMAVATKRQADYRYSVLARIFSWGFDRGLVSNNPCEKPGRVYKGNRAEFIWTDADEHAFMEKAPKHITLALILALWTGQRQGDLLLLKWSSYDGNYIRHRQEKGEARVAIPVGAPLKAALDEAKRKWDAIKPGKPRALTILATTRGTAWTEEGFRSSWQKACKKAGVVGLTFHDLRGTAITRLALAGCSVPEIATLTGHSLRDVDAILDAHYLNRDPRLAESAVRKLEKGAFLPTDLPTGSNRFNQE